MRAAKNFHARLAEKPGLAMMHRIDPERGHSLAIHALQMGLTVKPGPLTSVRLQTEIAGLRLPNPIGLAAGFDKNATAIAPLLKTGFGFIEVGGATALPQPGNPRPRLFRLREDQGVINRFGFNNDGADAIAKRLANRPATGIIGLNLGTNKNATEHTADFVHVLKTCAAHIDFATLNVSSPNTRDLRRLQGRTALSALLKSMLEARSVLARPIPIFLKIAPDLNEGELHDIADVALNAELDGIIATNTTLMRSGLISAHSQQSGGLSGQPLFEHSTRIVAKLSQLTDGKIPLIGVGGIATADQAYAKIRAGASAVQLYTALVYGGFSLVRDIVEGLDSRLQNDGFASIADAVGTDRSTWL